MARFNLAMYQENIKKIKISVVVPIKSENH